MFGALRCGSRRALHLRRITPVCSGATLVISLSFATGSVSMLRAAAQAKPLPQDHVMSDASTSPSNPFLNLSPGAAYREAMQPVEVVHRSIANWSSSEQASLAIAVKNGSVACSAHPASEYFGEDLVDLARLCDLGLNWPATLEATGRYLGDSKNLSQRGEAYALTIDAELRLKDESSALRDAKAMLEALPYDATTASASDEALDYMELRYTADAIALAAKREPLLLAALGRQVPSVDEEKARRPSATPTVAGLYQQATRLATLQQLNGELAQSELTVKTLNDAFSSPVSIDDRLAIERIVRQYHLLGQPLASLALSASLDGTRHLPQIPSHDAITVLLVFPDWCAQAIHLAEAIPKGVFTVEKHEASMYGVLVETVEQTKPSSPLTWAIDASRNFNPAYAEAYLRGTQTVAVTSRLLTSLNTLELPLLIGLDQNGIVRYTGVPDDNALQPGQTVDSVVSLIGKHWVKATASTTRPIPREAHRAVVVSRSE